jgi:hypothetical protein
MKIEVSGIPHASRELFEQLLEEDLRPVHELFNEVKAYARLATDQGRGLSEIDTVLVAQLADVSLKLLETIVPNSSEERRRLIQASVRYFLLEEDSDNDLDSVLGFDDDAEVTNAVLRHLGEGDWLIDIP